jgi:uncharacterized repeat protein (TIGR01451 family)
MAINLTTVSSVFQDGNANGFAEVGEQILYTFQIQNTEPGALTGIIFSNPNIVISPGFDGTLAIGATKTVTGLYTIQAGDLDNGRVVIAQTANAGAIVSTVSNDTENLTVRASLSVDKQADQILDTNGSGVTDAGDTIRYRIEVKNTSPRTAFNVSLNDFPGTTSTGIPVTLTGLTDQDADGALDDLAINGTSTGFFEYVIQQSDLDQAALGNAVLNRANARGSTKTNSAITGVATSTVDLGPQPAFEIIKTAGTTKGVADAGEFNDVDGNGVVNLGDRIKYTYQFKNTGNVTLSNIQGFDDNGIPGGPERTLVFTPATLAPGAVATATYEAPVTQDFLDKGTLTNTVRATATPPAGTPLDFKTDFETVIVKAPPLIDVTKTATPTLIDNAKVGDPVQYSYTLKNTGPVSLLNVNLLDDNGTPTDLTDDVTIDATGVKKGGIPIAGLPGLTGGLTDIDGDGAVDDLAVNVTTNAIYTGNLTQKAIDAGVVTNIVIGTGTDRQGTSVTDQATAKVTLNGTAAIDVTKTATPTLINNAKVGDPIQYNYTLKNTGTVSLLNVNLLDDNGTSTLLTDDVTIDATGVRKGGVLISPIGLTGGLTDIDNDGAIDDLAVGATTNGTYTTSLTQATIDAGSLTNIVIGTGTDPKRNPITDKDTAKVTLDGTATIDVTKVANPTIINNAKLGDPIQYSYTLKNTGPVSLLNVNLVDDNGTPTLLTDDVTINAIGAFRNGIQIVGAPGLTLGLTDIDGDGGIDDLAVGATTNGTYTTSLTQTIIDAGSVINFVIGTGTNPKGDPITDKDTAKVTVNGTSSIDVTKVANPLAINNPKVGDPVQYSYTLKNTGPTSLLNVNLVDDNGTPGLLTDDVTINAIGAFRNNIQIVGAPGLTLGLTDIDLDGAVDDLAVGATTTATYTSTLTQKAIEAGALINIVVGKGIDLKGNLVIDEATAKVTLNAPPLIDVTKVANPTLINNAKVGDPIQYSYTLKNTGPVSLLNVNLVDDNGTSGLLTDDVLINAIGAFRNGVQITGAPGLTLGLTDIDLDGAADDLAVGATTNATYTGNLTQAAIDAGSVTNVVIGKGIDARGTIVTDSANAIVTLKKPVLPPQITLLKTAGAIINNDHDPNPSAGDTVVYTYAVTNPGPVDLFNLKLIDDNGTPDVLSDDFVINIQGLVDLDRDGEFDDLAVDKTAFGFYTKTLSEADICAGFFTNIGTVEGFSITKQKVTATDPETITFGRPEIQLEKCAELDLGADCIANPGDVVKYSFHVSNTGNVALNPIVIIDPLLGNTPIEFANNITTLAPGECVDAFATYKLTQADIDNGTIHNLATAYGNPTYGNAKDFSDDVTATATANICIPQCAEITIDKVTVYSNERGEYLHIPVGSAISWEYTITNKGNVSLANIELMDQLTGVVDAANIISRSFNNDSILNVGETWVYRVAGTATEGDYCSDGVVKGGYKDCDGNAQSATATDWNDYVGYNPAPVKPPAELCPPAKSESWLERRVGSTQREWQPIAAAFNDRGFNSGTNNWSTVGSAQPASVKLI